MTTINTELYGVLNAVRVATKFGKPINELLPRIEEVLKNAETEKHAVLLNAAPDLLDACRESLFEARRINRAAGETVFNPTAFSMMESAIAKATPTN
jgi:predicted P-loop ATPase/GTPase